LEFKRDFDFRPARSRRDRKNRGFANIAGAQVQHDGTSCGDLIVALSGFQHIPLFLPFSDQRAGAIRRSWTSAWFRLGAHRSNPTRMAAMNDHHDRRLRPRVIRPEHYLIKSIAAQRRLIFSVFVSIDLVNISLTRHIMALIETGIVNHKMFQSAFTA
jgi:hypothetical protein